MSIKNRTAKLVIVSLVVLLALAGIGVGFASWTDQVVITETVGTGELCLEYVLFPTISDPFKPPPNFPTDYPDWSCDPGFVNCRVLDKNVGWGTAQYLDTDEDGIPDALEVTLNNVYPCYYNHIDFWVHNCGTIPFIISGAVITVNGEEIDITGKGQHIELDLNGNGEPDFELLWGDDTVGAQVHPCTNWNISYAMHVLQDEDPDFQNNTFTFTIELEVIQWNEYVPPATPSPSPTIPPP